MRAVLHSLRAGSRSLFWAGILAMLFPMAGVSFAAENPPAMDPREILGPLPVLNFSPFHLLFFEFTPERAYALPRGRMQIRLDIYESNTLFDNQFNQPFLRADLEMTRFTWRGRYGLTDRLTLGVNVPLVYTHGLFLDAFIDAVEKAFGREDEDRKREIQNEVNLTLATNGVTDLNINDGGFGVGDLSAEALYQLVQESFWVPAVSFRVAVKFPTGEFRQVRGSGKFDYAFGLAIQKIWGLWSASTGGGVTIPGNPFSDPALDPDPFFYAHLSVERMITSNWSIALQFKWVDGLMDLGNSGLTIEALTNQTLELNGAVKWAFARNWLAQFGLVQDIADSENAAADFTFYISLGLQIDTK